MWIYSFIMILTAAIMIAVGTSVYGGKTELIHSYHQKRVTDQAGYGRAMGRGLIVMGVFFNVSGILSLFWRTDAAAKWSVGIMMFGIAVGIVLMVYAQKKYNKGIF